MILIKKSMFLTALFLSFSISYFAFAMEEDEDTPVQHFFTKAKQPVTHNDKNGLWGYDKILRMIGLTKYGFEELNRQHIKGHTKTYLLNKKIEETYQTLSQEPDRCLNGQHWVPGEWVWSKIGLGPNCPECESVLEGFKIFPTNTNEVDWNKPLTTLPRYILKTNSNLKLDRLRKYTVAFEKFVYHGMHDLKCNLKDQCLKKNEYGSRLNKIGESHSQYGKVEHFEHVQYTHEVMGPLYFKCTRCTNDYPQGKNPYPYNVGPRVSSIAQTDYERIMTLENTSDLVPPCHKPIFKGLLLEIWENSNPQSNRWDHTLEEMWKGARQLDLKKCGVEPKNITYKVKSGDWCVIF